MSKSGRLFSSSGRDMALTLCSVHWRCVCVCVCLCLWLGCTQSYPSIVNVLLQLIMLLLLGGYGGIGECIGATPRTGAIGGRIRRLRASSGAI